MISVLLMVTKFVLVNCRGDKGTLRPNLEAHLRIKDIVSEGCEVVS